MGFVHPCIGGNVKMRLGNRLGGYTVHSFGSTLWGTVVNTVMNLQVVLIMRNLLSSIGTTSFSRRIFVYRVNPSNSSA